MSDLPQARRRASAVIRATIAGGVSLGALAAAERALAQAPEPTVLPPVTVTATPTTSTPTAPSLDDARRELLKTPGGVSIVPAETIRDGRAGTVKDALDFVPGVFAQPKYGQEDARLTIRGSGLSRNFHMRGIRIMIDGVPMNLADGGADTQELDPLAVRYIEVFKGGNALQWGAASLGGAINYVSPTGRDAPRLLIRTEAGSFGTFGGQFASGQAAETWDYWVTSTFSHADGYRQHTQRDYLRYAGNFGFRLGPGIETRFYTAYQDIDQKIPSSLTRARAYAAPATTDPGSFALGTRRDIDSARIANRTTFLLGDDELTATAWYRHKILFHPLAFGIVDNVSDDYGGTLRFKGHGMVGGFRDEYVVGANLFAGRNVNKTFANSTGHRGAPTNHVLEKSVNLELYGENRFFIDPTVALITALQFNHSRRRLVDRFPANGDDTGTKVFDSVNPKLGVLWEPRKDLQLFANVSRASEPPTFSELNPSATPGFANLKPQKSWTAEIGARGRWRGVGFDLSIYRAWVKDELQLFVVPGSGAGGFALNADRTIHQGAELGIDATVLEGLATPAGGRQDRLDFRLAYTFSDFRFRNDPVYGDNQLPGQPRHYLRAELRYSHPLGFFIAPNVEWVPRGYHVDNANTRSQRTKAYALAGAKAGWAFDNGLSVYLDARNLFNKTHVSNTSVRPVALATDALYNPGEGRAVFVGLEFKW